MIERAAGFVAEEFGGDDVLRGMGRLSGCFETGWHSTPLDERGSRWRAEQAVRLSFARQDRTDERPGEA
jgi:hypothetical protein